MFEELRVNELLDMKQKGILEAGGVAGTLKLSAFGQEYFERLIESLPAKDQVAIRLMVGGNAEKTEAQVKAFMQ